MLVPAIVAAVLLVARAAADGCPGRAGGRGREDWEQSERSTLMAGYDKNVMRCPSVDVIIVPLRLQVSRDFSVSTMDAGIILNWEDPFLPKAETRVVLNASDMWVPELTTSGVAEHLLTAKSALGLLETVEATNRVRSFRETKLRGWCTPYRTEDWPRDQVHCAFIVKPASWQSFNLTHSLSVKDVVQWHQELLNGKSPIERLASWQLQHLDSKLYVDRALYVEAVLRRLPAQLEAELVHPVLAVAALVPASVALPPGCGERPALLAVSFLLHVAFLLNLPTLAGNLEGDATPRALLVYRDVGLLLLVVALQWLLSLRIASRTRPLSSWSQSMARGLSMLRTILLLPVTAPVLKPLDEQSVELSKILDRLTFLAVSASYIALVIIGLQ
ncbi:uncharacterized protein LOC113213817 [Frankliniella occidentalis]|uniref:Uncharacterized protein LOC113213817 n=1 Tax=Frankliniella occidentalis TaxID=133901 RepID=A0A6J1TAU5_FRAOC|nr:uncharacterized protein LOC113213817 [Frankliniella occidentalis]